MNKNIVRVKISILISGFFMKKGNERVLKIN